MIRAPIVSPALVALLMLGGCGPASDGGFGPPHIVENPRADAAHTLRVPPGYERASMLAGDGTLTVRRTRIDVGDPVEQNWEVEIDVRADADSADGDELLVAWMTGRNSTGGTPGATVSGLRVARSGDGARTFTPIDIAVPQPARPIPFDPTVEFDPVDGRAYVSAMGQATTPTAPRSIWVARSLGSDASAFAPAVLVPQNAENPDKGWLAAGRTPTSADTSVLYFFDRRGVIASLDGGATWSAPVKPSSSATLVQPLVLPDGTLGVAYFSAAGQALFARSADLGRTFSASRPIHTFVADFAELTGAAIAGGFRSPPTTVFARNPVDGRLYAVLADVTRRNSFGAELDVLLFESSDNGTTWSAPRNVTADAPVNSDQFQPWIAVDATGRLHLAYADTRRTAGADLATTALVDFWYAVSADRGASWSAVRLTEAAIPSERTRWNPFGLGGEAQFVGDYFTVAVSTHAAYVAHPVYEADTIGMAVSRIDFASQGGTTINDPRGLTGPWYEPATSGQGFEFHWLAGDRLLVFFYGHRDNGQNIFLVGTRDGRFAYGESIDVPLVVTSGGRFNGLDPNAIQRTPWGSVRLRFDSCAAANARLDGVDGVQTLNLERLALAPALPCD